MLAVIKQDKRSYSKAFAETHVGSYIIDQLKSVGRNQMLRDSLKNMYNRELVRFMMFK